jgi:hypothetical protein
MHAEQVNGRVSLFAYLMTFSQPHRLNNVEQQDGYFSALDY